jgi:tripartite-type tricarboxylate transporter receptor subunit TctC
MKRFKYLGALALSLAASCVAAQSYPTRPVSLVVPFAAGGPTDVAARALATAMEKPLGGQVIVENKVGAGGTLAVGDVARSQPDGYRILIHHIGMATAPALYRKLAFDPLKDFEYIGQVLDVPMTILVKKDLPVSSIRELASYARANKEKITLANAGLGAASHLCGLLFQQAVKIDMTTIPYKGTGPAMTDLLGGQVDLMCDQTTNTTQQIAGGKVKAFAVTTSRRLSTPALASLPTLDEAGLKGFNVSVWHGLYAPKGTPAAVLTRVNTALKAAIKDTAFVSSMESLGAVIVNDARINPAEHKRFVETEIAKWGPVIRAAGEYAD